MGIIPLVDRFRMDQLVFNHSKGCRMFQLLTMAQFRKVYGRYMVDISGYIYNSIGLWLADLSFRGLVNELIAG